METAKCLICECEIEIGENNEGPYEAGCCNISFHFGSRYDQMLGFDNARNSKSEDPIEKLLSCDQIEAVICDDCFSKKAHLCQGFKIVKTTKRKRIC